MPELFLLHTLLDSSYLKLIFVNDDFRLSVRCQRYESISNFQFHPLTVSRKNTHTNEIL
jgi:hypothetical protein